MSREPVIEEARFHVTCGVKLKPEPVLGMIEVNLVRNVRHLRTPYKPMALQGSVEGTIKTSL